MPDRFDLAVVGSGGASFAAAIAARRKGRSVVMIERATVGGTCVNVGCIPSKALLAAAEARHVAMDTRFPGIATRAELVDMGALIDGKDQLVDELRVGKYENLAELHGWEIVRGEARFVSGPVLEVEGGVGEPTRTIAAEHYLIATGARPAEPDIPGLAEAGYLTSTSAMELDHVPASMIVFGGGYVGLEQGQLFARLGTKVTMVARSQLASREEPEVTGVLGEVFAAEGIDVVQQATVSEVRREGDEVVVTLRAGDAEQVLRAEQILVAIGRQANTEALNLNAVGVKVDERGGVVVDDHLRTANPQIWAGGDCVSGSPQFVYVAAAQGSVVADNAFDNAGRTMDYRQLPRVTFTTPNIAAVGMTDAEANARGHRCDCRVLPLKYVPRALVNRDTRGFAKIVADADSRRVLGITVVGLNAGDTILAGVYAIEAGMTVEEMAKLWCPYLTMAEAIKLCAQAFSQDVATLSCCAA